MKIIKYISKITKIIIKIIEYIFKVIIKIKIEILLTLIGILISYLSFYIALPFYNEYKENNTIPNINGNWEMQFITEETSYMDYKGMPIYYNVFFLGDKNKYVGKGEKIKIWEKDLIENQRDRIEMEIIITGNNIYGIYYLYGKNRNTDGNFQLTIDDDGKSFTGTFLGNAADSKGTVIGNKIN